MEFLGHLLKDGVDLGFEVRLKDGPTMAGTALLAGRKQGGDDYEEPLKTGNLPSKVASCTGVLMRHSSASQARMDGVTHRGRSGADESARL